MYVAASPRGSTPGSCHLGHSVGAELSGRDFPPRRFTSTIQSMTVDVLLFASYADALGSPSVSVDVGPDATVAEILTAIANRPGGDLLPRRPLVAVNQRFVTAETRIYPTDEIALVPPVAGG